ncbi:MAG: valine--tRNA ligase [Candidatus Nanoarchaeia archaeon]|nr:valine--tRNA ligase [Candidatus Nanoarchaeia archaeon]
MDNVYDYAKTEKRLLEYWRKEKIYKFNPNSEKPIYSVDTPPPTVSGAMHIGHSASYTQQDVIVRYKKLRGFEIFYPFGTDDNGLPTERLIEKLKNVKAVKMDRQKFIELCLSTLKEIRPDFVNDWKKIGMSCDFDVFYSTIDEHCRRVSQRSFIELYEAGREYRKKAPTVWCPVCETAIAQVELEDKELESQFNDIVFKTEDGKDLIISTTRPELIPSIVAMFAHPDDDRYKGLFGKKAKAPLFDIWVPILPDEKAEPEKGTGIVMCCTFGDQTDIEWYKQHKLPLRISITKDGKMTDLAGKYKGMEIKEARKVIIEDLEKEGLLKGIKKIKHPVNVHDKCGTEVEILETEQWFIKYLDLKKEFLKSGKEMKWRPKHMRNRYDNWIKGLKWDWCISRQRFFGVPFPVWYCKNCSEVILADKKSLPVEPLKDKPPVKICAKCRCREFIPEKDVFDTWATSSLTPKIAAELFKNHKIFKKLYPMSMRPNAHDIITFWLFNTVVKSRMHDKVNPWKDIMISGWVLDPHGKKMSKSKGNTIAPQDILEKYGADVLRFWATNTKLGEDVRFREEDLLRGRKVLVKLWNASRFVNTFKTEGKTKKEHVTDLWIKSKLSKVIAKATKSLDEYEYSSAKKVIIDFFFRDFCDFYLEMVKYRLYSNDKASKNSAINTLREVLFDVLILLAPYTPYITDELYLILFSYKKSIHLEQWPISKKIRVSAEVRKTKYEEIGDLLVKVVEKIRKWKTDNKIGLGNEVEELTLSGVKELSNLKGEIKGIMKINKLNLKTSPKLKIN